MIPIATPGYPSDGGDPSVIHLARPVTARQIAVKMRTVPFKIIGDLMMLNHFHSVDDELPDDALEQLSSRYEVLFCTHDPS